MIRGFVTGVVWGGVVAGAGLAVVSQVAPLPLATVPAPQAAAPAAEAIKTPKAVIPAPTSDLPVEEPVAAATPAAAPQPDPALPPAAPEQDASAPQDEAPVSPMPAAPALSGTDGLTAPDTGEAVSPPPATTVADLPSVAPLPTVPPLVSDAAPDGAEPPPAAETLLAPAPQQQADAPPAQDFAAATPEKPRLIVPEGKPLIESGLPKAGVLPRIGDAAPAEGAALAVATPLDLFSRPFDNPDGKPLFSILLIDTGAADTDRETLAALPFPVTFVIDPTAPAAAEAAAIYLRGGQEVVISTNAVPKGATPADIEQSYQAFDMAVPEAVAFLGIAGLAENGQQLAAAAVPVISAQGRGVVTMERGLNAVSQVAQRESVPQATVFRLLDAQDESVPLIRRYLDRAAFRAAQEGSVVVLGNTRPDTIAALLQWNVEGRAASVALAPVSAVLKAGE